MKILNENVSKNIINALKEDEHTYTPIEELEKRGDKSYLDKKSAWELYRIWEEVYNLTLKFPNDKRLEQDLDYWDSRLENLHE